MADNAAKAGDDRAGSKRIGALAALWPFVRPYRWLALAALAALTLTAAVSLVLPMAVRRVIDNFGAEDADLLDRYFGAALGIAALFALGSAMRFYIVSRLGERVVADIRKAVFARMVGMSPAFYERLMTGEVISRITTDTTLILSVIGSSASWFLRNALIFAGGLALMLVSSGKLSGLVLMIVPAVILPIVLLGRRMRALSRETQDWIAQSSGAASEALLSVQTVQAFTHEAESREAFAAITEKSYAASLKRIATRAVMTVFVIFLVFAGIVGVLWVGANDVREGAMTPGELVQFVIYAVMVASSVAALSEIWGELQRAAGATERLVELLHAGDTVRRIPPRARSAFTMCASTTLRGPASRRWTGSASRSARARRWRWSARPAPARRRSCNCCCASTIRSRAASPSTASTCARCCAAISATPSRWCRRTR